MKPQKIDRIILEGRAIRLIRAALSKYTLDPYERRLVNFLHFVGSKSLDKFVLKAKKNKKWVEEQVLEYILKQIDRAKNDPNFS